MLDQVEDLLKAGIWLGPSVLGSLFYRFVAESASAGHDDVAGGVMLATAAVVMTVVSVRLHGARNAALAPVAFIAMFVASWSML